MKKLLIALSISSLSMIGLAHAASHAEHSEYDVCVMGGAKDVSDDMTSEDAYAKATEMCEGKGLSHNAETDMPEHEMLAMFVLPTEGGAGELGGVSPGDSARSTHETDKVKEKDMSDEDTDTMDEDNTELPTDGGEGENQP